MSASTRLMDEAAAWASKNHKECLTPEILVLAYVTAHAAERIEDRLRAIEKAIVQSHS